MKSTRNIPLELAQHQRQRGASLTRSEFVALGYTDEHLSDANIKRAANLFAEMTGDSGH